MIKKTSIAITLVLLVGIFVLYGCVIKEEAKTTKTDLSYNNNDFGVFFDYPSNFQVYQQDEDNLRIESDYKNSESPGISLGMNIKRIDSQRETQEQIENRLSPSRKSVLSKEKKVEFELLKISDNEYYILSDKGTFYIGDSIDVYKSTLEQKGLYQDYKSKFNKIINSIKII